MTARFSRGRREGRCRRRRAFFLSLAPSSSSENSRERKIDSRASRTRYGGVPCTEACADPIEVSPRVELERRDFTCVGCVMMACGWVGGTERCRRSIFIGERIITLLARSSGRDNSVAPEFSAAAS